MLWNLNKIITSFCLTPLTAYKAKCTAWVMLMTQTLKAEFKESSADLNFKTMRDVQMISAWTREDYSITETETFQKWLKGHDGQSCHDDRAKVRHLFPTKSKVEHDLLRAITRNIKTYLVLEESCVASSVNWLYKATLFCQIRAESWLQGPNYDHLVLIKSCFKWDVYKKSPMSGPCC